MLPSLYFKWVFSFYSWRVVKEREGWCGFGRRRGRRKLSLWRWGLNFRSNSESTMGCMTKKEKLFFCLSVLIFFVRLSVFCCNIREDIRERREGDGRNTLPRPSWLWVVSYQLCLSQERVNRRKPNTNMWVYVCVCVCGEGLRGLKEGGQITQNGNHKINFLLAFPMISSETWIEIVAKSVRRTGIRSVWSLSHEMELVVAMLKESVVAAR